MTFTNSVLAWMPLLIILSPFLVGGCAEWLKTRPGSASEFHVRRIKEMCKKLGEKPICDPATLSWNEAIVMCDRLENRVRPRPVTPFPKASITSGSKRYLERTYIKHLK